MLKDIKKKTDTYSKKSEDALKEQISKAIRHVFAKSLTCIELKFGKDFEGYSTMRAEILRAGNDAIRDIHNAIERGYNIETIPSVFTFLFGKEGE